LALEKIRVELEIEKERFNKKKSNDKEKYLSWIRESEKKIEQKKNQKEILKLTNLKYIKEFEELLEMQEKERSNSNPRKIIPVNENLENKVHIAKKQEDDFKSYNEIKYLKEKSDIDNK